MKIKIIPLSVDVFKENQQVYDCANFLQSCQMAVIQQQRKKFIKTELIGFLYNNRLIGQTIINYQKKYRFFKEAVIVHGPLLDYTNVQLVNECFNDLEKYLRKKGVIRLTVHPYLMNTYKQDEQIVLKENQFGDVIQLLTKRNYTHLLGEDKELIGAHQLFIKNLDVYETVEEIYASFSQSLKRDLKKYQDAKVRVRELNEDELSIFYDILKDTGNRKGFYIQNKDFFQKLKQQFKEDAKFLVAYMNQKEYRQYLDENIEKLKCAIDALKEKVVTRKIKGKLTDLADQLASYEKRLYYLDSLKSEQEILYLSAYVFIIYKNEMVSFSGGNDEKFLHFGGSTLINWEAIQYAKKNNIPLYNFYGTIETEKSKQNKGNFNYKKQFDGQLVVLTGTFIKKLWSIF